jgi:hypothetical protein
MLTGLDDLPQPHALVVAGDVLHLVRDGAAVRRLQRGQRFRQRRAGNVDAQEVRRHAGHALRRQPKRLRVKGGIAGRLAAQRVEVRGQMAEGPIRPHQRHGSRDVAWVGGGHCRRWGRNGGRLRLLRGRSSLGPGAQRAEQVLVELVRPGQEAFDPPQEAARFGALDHAVVVRRGDGHHPRTRITDRAGGHDGALARHQPRDGSGRAQRSRVSERDGGADVVVRREAVRAGLLDELLVPRVELGEVHAVGSLDDRHHQEAAAIGPLHVDGQAQVDAAGIDPVRSAIGLEEVMGHGRLLRRRPHDGPADEVGEADLLGGDLRVQRAAPLLEGGDRHVAERRGGGYGQRRCHVPRQARRRPLDRRRAGR